VERGQQRRKAGCERLGVAEQCGGEVRSLCSSQHPVVGREGSGGGRRRGLGREEGECRQTIEGKCSHPVVEREEFGKSGA
jgi:hypothetical protein